jgi:hypothetical protein
MSSGVLERHTIPAPLVAPVVKNPVICHEIEKKICAYGKQNIFLE